MTRLPLIPSRTCSHHDSTPFPPGSEDGVEDSVEQSQYFQDIALSILHLDYRIKDPIAEAEDPRFGKLVEEIRCLHRANQRYLRLSDTNLRLGVLTNCPCCRWMTGLLRNGHVVRQSCVDYFALLSCDEKWMGVRLPGLSVYWVLPRSIRDKRESSYLTLTHVTDPSDWDASKPLRSWAPSGRIWAVCKHTFRAY